MLLTLQDTQRIQQFLLDKGFIQDEPNGLWNFNKSSGYKTYLESKGLPNSEINEVPYNRGMLTTELQEYLGIPDNISVVESVEENTQTQVTKIESVLNANGEIDFTNPANSIFIEGHSGLGYTPEQDTALFVREMAHSILEDKPAENKSEEETKIESKISIKEEITEEEKKESEQKEGLASKLANLVKPKNTKK